jgi:hypothetical protein
MRSSGEARPSPALVLRQDSVRVDGTLERIEEGLTRVSRRLAGVVQRVQTECPDAAAQVLIALPCSTAAHR